MKTNLLCIILTFFVLINFQFVKGADENQVMGDWEGNFQTANGDYGTLESQVIDEGAGTYRAIILIEMGSVQAELMGTRNDQTVVFTGKIDVGPELGGSYEIKAEITEGKFAGTFKGYENSGTIELKKIEKKSPTLGLEPPAGAIVLFDGKNLKKWQKVGGGKPTWEVLPTGEMEVRKNSIVTKDNFGDHQLHLEFRTPFMPEARGQKRGNSGVYVAGRYEVQVLDSYGLTPADNLCGGIYKKAVPSSNACYPPLSWQTYDITFYAPKFDAVGTKIKPAEISVKHNGILIHDRLVLDGPTPGGVDQDETKPGGLMLQDHGAKVQYKNIWILPIK